MYAKNALNEQLILSNLSIYTANIIFSVMGVPFLFKPEHLYNSSEGVLLCDFFPNVSCKV